MKMLSIIYFLKRYVKFGNADAQLEKWIERYYRWFVTQKNGVAKRNGNRKVILSLTTIPARIDKVWITIESLLRQTYKPDEIILWLAKDEFSNMQLPKRLKGQQKRGLTIRYCDNLKSYKKFYYTALLNPTAYIVTVDDDIIYAENMLKDLAKTYKKYPGCIICNRSHLIRSRKGKILPYRRWEKYEKRSDIKGEPSYCNFFTSGAGTLFPMFLMDRRILDKNAFMKLAPTADDVWLNFMAWVSGLKTKNTENGLGAFITIESSSQKGLFYQNVRQQKNDKQIEAVVRYLNIKINDYLIGENKNEKGND